MYFDWEMGNQKKYSQNFLSAEKKYQTNYVFLVEGK